MLIRFFRSNSPSAFIILPFIALLIWALGFMEPGVATVKHTMPLYELITRPFLLYPWLGILSSLIFIVATAFLLTYTVNENEVTTRPSQLPGLFYVLLMSNNHSMLAFYPLIPANFFLLLALHRLLSSYRKDRAFSHSFDGGLLISISSLFYLPYVLFLPLLGVGLIILRPFNWREWFISFLGALTPYLFTLTFYFWNDGLEELWHDKILQNFSKDRILLPLSPGYYPLMILGWGILLLAFGKLLGKMGSGPQRAKKGILLFLWCFICGSVAILLAPEVSTKYFASLALPAAVFYTFLFLHTRREWLGEILFFLFFGTMIATLLLHYF